MSRYSKADVDFRSDNWGPRRPAIRVKADRFPCVWQIADHYDWEEDPDTMRNIERALEWTFETHRESFWEQAQEEVDRIFPTYGASSPFGSYIRKLKVYSEGRSGGWLVVDGLEPFESWDAVYLGYWHSLVRWCEQEVAYLCSLEAVIETIEANEWLDMEITE